MALSTIDTSSISALGYGFKNRIINGAMVLDQRSSGASVIPGGTSTYLYITDRWAYNPTQASKMTWGQNLNSIAPPAGYTYYLGGQVGASANVTVGSGDYFFLRQAIEGYNVADFGFGAAGASSLTLSFWVRSSLTGTFGGTIENSGLNRGYPFTYTISAANTWEQKTITITGDVTGSWGTTNGVGFDVRFGLGAGASYKATSGSWQAVNTVSATGAVDLIATNNATFYITGVQLEKGVTATAYDHRSVGTELSLCQRYYQNCNYGGTWYANSSGVYVDVEDASLGGPCFPVVMRADPTVTFWAGSANTVRGYGGLAAVTVTTTYSSRYGVPCINHSGTYTVGRSYTATWKAEAELL